MSNVMVGPHCPSSGLQPRDTLKLAQSQLPPTEAVVMDPYRCPHPLALGAEPTVMQHPDDILRSVAGAHIQPDEAVRPVAQPSIVEILVQREEGYSPGGVQQGQQVTVLRPQPTDLAADPAVGHTRTHQARSLIVREILVEPVHAARTGTARERRCCNRPWSSNHASRANFTASPTAARGMRPPQRV